jgi:hypothetical protein
MCHRGCWLEKSAPCDIYCFRVSCDSTLLEERGKGCLLSAHRNYSGLASLFYDSLHYYNPLKRSSGAAVNLFVDWALYRAITIFTNFYLCVNFYYIICYFCVSH